MFPRHDHRAARKHRRCTAGASSPAASRRTASASCSRSPAATCSRSTTAAATEGIDLVDVRHESAAAFAAEGWAKVTREPGVCALTAGPGVTNGMSALGSAQQNHSPMLVLGGRAPAMRWGQGSLQEIDHVPFVRPLVKLAATAAATAEIPGLVDEALARCAAPALRADVPRLPARPGLHGGARSPSRAEPHARTRPAPDAADARPRRRPAARRRAAGDHGRHEPLLGPRRGRAARARRGGRHPRVPQRPRARLPGRRPPAVLLARAQRGAQGRRRGARRRRADGLPARLRPGLRPGLRADRRRRRRARARAPAPGRRRALRRPRRRRCGRSPARPRAARRHGRLDRAPARRSRRRSARPSASSSTTRARRCTRCASTRSSARCSTATRS